MNKSITPTIEMYDTATLASKLMVSESQLEKARSTHSLDIPFVKIGKSVRYEARAVANWLLANTVRQ